MSPCWALYPGWGLPDDPLGPGQAQELQEGVQGLPQEEGHHTVLTLNALKIQQS